MSDLRRRILCWLSLACTLVLSSTSGCMCGGVNSEDEARIAYLGLDQVVARSLTLGFAGFNAASSANIPPQSADGDESGTIGVTGQVDQGASANKGMRLSVALGEYSDGPIDDPETDEEEEIKIVFDTPEGEGMAFGIQLRDIPDGTHSGTLAGRVLMEGDLSGEIEVSLSFAGEIESDGDGGTRRTPGTTDVTGTAMSASGEYQVDTTI